MMSFGRSLIFPLHKRPPSVDTLNPHRKVSLKKHLKEYLERLKDDILNDAIEGEQSHLEATHISSPSMPTLDTKTKLIFNTILVLYESSCALSLETHDDPSDPQRHPNHRIHQDHREEQHQWLVSIQNLYAIAIEWMDKAIDETNPRDNNAKSFEQSKKSTLEFENDGDISEHGSHLINTTSSFFSFEKSPDSIGLCNFATHEIFTPSHLMI
jgi:hypothetical protein